MELDRKAFHFDLDVEALKRFYSDKDSTSWNDAWSDIQDILLDNGFEKPQYSGYESQGKMTYQEAYTVIRKLSEQLPWFSLCIKAATFTEIGESYDVGAYLKKGMQVSLPLKPETRKEFHFDLDECSLKAAYPSTHPNAWRGAWGTIARFMVGHGFEHTQHSGYESGQTMSMEQALSVIDGLQNRYPWFSDSVAAASMTEIGERHDAFAYIKAAFHPISPSPLREKQPGFQVSREDKSLLRSETKDMKDAASVLSKQSDWKPFHMPVKEEH